MSEDLQKKIDLLEQRQADLLSEVQALAEGLKPFGSAYDRARSAAITAGLLPPEIPMKDLDWDGMFSSLVREGPKPSHWLLAWALTTNREYKR